MEHFNPAPPSTVTIATGPKGGAYEFFAQQYREKLAQSHVKLNIRITDGTSENIRLLEDPTSGVQIAFVVGGDSNSQKAPGLLSLGRVDYQVFWLIYRGTETRPPDATQGQTYWNRAGRRRHHPRPRSCRRQFSECDVVAVHRSAAVEALVDGRLDAIFVALAPESSIIQPLSGSPCSIDERFSDRRSYPDFPDFIRLVLPQGVIDLEHNIPPNDVNLIGTTNAVVVREDLHPEIIDLLAKTLVEVHGGAGIFQRAGEFPTQTDPEFALPMARASSTKMVHPI